MLKDAALLQLALGREALAHDLTLKDASPYNVQWRGAEPVFIDIGSFERLRPGEPWAGYRQFCMLYLYPLMLQAYRGVPYHAWLRGSIDGITPAEARGLLPKHRRGVLTHVVLHARLEARYADAGGREVKRELKRAGFRKELLDANLRKLEKLVAPARVPAGPHGLERVRHHQHVQRRGGAPQGRVRARRGRPPAGWAHLGPRLQRRHVLARGGRARRPRGGDRRRPRHRRRAVPGAEGSQRHPAARDERHRPVARPRLARPRARFARAPRHARPGARAGARPPRRDHRQRAPHASSSTGCARSTARS